MPMQRNNLYALHRQHRQRDNGKQSTEIAIAVRPTTAITIEHIIDMQKRVRPCIERAEHMCPNTTHRGLIASSVEDREKESEPYSAPLG